ncbi:acyltransferase domain-containing protein, partial [Streptomyces sp. NRRL F-7442]|uniref:acyltransferase domain-containing protein n=2 Tax=unclassified Streptomyces TaxID=2593676 RepID=UPI001F41F873
MQSLPPGGAMAAVALPPHQIQQTEEFGNLEVAAVNGPASVVISGTQNEVDTFLGTLDSEVRTRRLRVSHAFHSRWTEPVLARFAEALQEITFREPVLAGVSNVTGGPVDGQWNDPEYW